VPIVTFVNKLDREGRDPFDLLDEIEQALALNVTPASSPIGMGRDFLAGSGRHRICLRGDVAGNLPCAVAGDGPDRAGGSDRDQRVRRRSVA
jgi:translation elongation factor EF-G